MEIGDDGKERGQRRRKMTIERCRFSHEEEKEDREEDGSGGVTP
jgi:hypothetical protein